MTRRSDAGDLATEWAELSSAATTDDFRRALVMHPPAHRGADPSEPLLLLGKHHDVDPAGSAETAMLLLTDPRWRDGAGTLVGEIEASGIVDDDQLDRLAEAFLAGDTILWPTPDNWWSEEIIVIDFGVGHGEANEDGEDEESEDGDNAGDDDDLPPALVRREVFLPLRRWAAGRLAGRDPRRWSDVLGRADGLRSRDAAALVTGLLDVVEVLDPAAQEAFIQQASRWPHHSVRRKALGLIVARQGPVAAHAIAQGDPDAGIRKWAESVVHPAPEVDEAGPPTLF